MRKILLLLMFLPMLLSAQGKFGFYSHKEVLMAVPEYLLAIEEFELLKQRCNAEIERNEQELTRKYVAFLDGQQDFPEPILRKRQKELQQMVDNSVLFRDRLKVWLSQAKDSLLAPCNERVDIALAKVCERMGLAYAINSDEVMYRYVNPKYGEEITPLVLEEVLNPTVETVPTVVECAEDEAAEDANDELGAEEKRVDSAVEAVATDIVTGVATETQKVATDTVVIATDKEAVDSVRVATDIIE
ncbi:MAG: OmpH family outer membrane protein [Bacteroidaceae bacterium]|nr:OmpH family outer membrane protein [Bacteroidaceae bacterium]